MQTQSRRKLAALLLNLSVAHLRCLLHCLGDKSSQRCPTVVHQISTFWPGSILLHSVRLLTVHLSQVLRKSLPLSLINLLSPLQRAGPTLHTFAVYDIHIRLLSQGCTSTCLTCSRIWCGTPIPKQCFSQGPEISKLFLLSSTLIFPGFRRGGRWLCDFGYQIRVFNMALVFLRCGKCCDSRRGGPER